MKTRHKAHMVILAVGLVALFLLTGCLGDLFPKRKVIVPGPESGPGPKPEVQLSEQEMLRQAEKANREGRKEDAVTNYRAFLDNYPNSQSADSAKAALGQLHEGLGQSDRAIAAYQDLVRNHPNSRFSPEASHRLAALYLGAGRYDEAQDLLMDMLSRATDPAKKARLRVLLGRAYLGKGNRSQSMDLFLRAYQETPDQIDREEAHRGIKATIALMTLDELPLAQTEYVQEYPGGYVAYVYAYRLQEAGRIDEAEEQLGVFFDRFPDHEMADDAKALLLATKGQGRPPKLTFVDDFGLVKAVSVETTDEPLETGPLPDYKAMDIAVVLPLSESGVAKYGQMVLSGLKLAVNAYQARTPGFRINLVEYDTQGKPDLAAQMVEKAAARDNVLAIVGPLLSKEAVRAAPKAEELSVPMVAISQKEGVTRVGRHIFRIFLTSKVQAEAVAMYSVQVLGLNQLAILYPDEPYGREMRDYFQNEAKRLGAQIVASQSYSPKASEYSSAIQNLSGVGKALRRVGAGRKVRVPFEAVFLPDSYSKVAMIAPQFAYHDITTIRLLGTNLWHTPKLLSTVSRYVQRCVIPTAFFADEADPSVRQFLEAYRAEKADPTAEPSQFEAYGYDAGRLLATLMDRRHVSTREDLVNALRDMGPFSGVTGRFRFDRDGEYKSEPMLLTVEGTEFKPVQ